MKHATIAALVLLVCAASPASADLGRTCQGYAMEMTVPMNVGQEAILMRMSGTI